MKNSESYSWPSKKSYILFNTKWQPLSMFDEETKIFIHKNVS